MVIRVTLLREYCGSAAFGRLLGIIMASGAAGGIVGPTLAGWVFDMFGNYQWAWYGFMGIMTLPTIMILRWDVKKALTN